MVRWAIGAIILLAVGAVAGWFLGLPMTQTGRLFTMATAALVIVGGLAAIVALRESDR